MQNKYSRNYWAVTVRGRPVVIPDYVASEQRRVNATQQTFPVLCPVTTRRIGYAVLRGDLYGLGYSGTGDVIVAMQ